MVFTGRTIDLPAAKLAPASLQPDFRRLVGDAAWAALPATVRARFGLHRAAVQYPGTMLVRANWLGRLFAQVCRLAGTPLAPWIAEDVPVTVSVRTLPDGASLWERAYAYPGRAPVVIASRKEAAPDGSLFEVTRGGLGMRLDVTAEDRALIFRSTAYFWRLAGVRLPIPLWLTPGRACVVHRDLGGGRFHFGLSFVHPLAGETFVNAGDFRDPTP